MEVIYRVDKNPPLTSIPVQKNPLQVLAHYFSEIH